MSNFCPHCGKPLGPAQSMPSPRPVGNVIVEGKITKVTEKAVLLDFFQSFRSRTVWIPRKLIEWVDIQVGDVNPSVAAWFAQKEKLEVVK